jgi:hypothetical protein
MPFAPFVPLRVLSSYSLLESAIDPKAIARVARHRGFPAIAICDRNGLYGASVFAAACIAEGVQPIVGALLGVAREEGGAIDYLPLYAQDETGWNNLCHLVSHLSGFIKDVFTEPQYPDKVHDPYGGLLLNQSGYIDTKGYLSAVRDWLDKSDSFSAEHFDYDALTLNEDSVKYKNLLAAHIIFCEGRGVVSNKFFNWLPISPLKGETITIKAKFLDSVLVNRGVYVVPGGTDEWRVGSTYKFNPTDDRVTEEGRIELRKNLESLIKVEYNVIHQEAGFRPVTPDRKPVLGNHPEHPTVLIFNGMGTKGVSLTPYFSDMLFQSLNIGVVIKKEVDISRFKSLYWKSH